MKSFISRWLQRDETTLGVGTQADPNSVNFPCEVIACIGHLQFTVRGDNGRSYKVQSADYMAHLMRYRARVRITGVIKEGVIWAESIVPLGQENQFQLTRSKWRH